MGHIRVRRKRLKRMTEPEGRQAPALFALPRLMGLVFPFRVQKSPPFIRKDILSRYQDSQFFTIIYLNYQLNEPRDRST